MPEQITTAQVNKFLDENRSTIDTINKQMFESSFRPVTAIYVDLNCFKDTRLGYLIYKCKEDPKKIQYLKDHIAQYNTSPQRSFTLAYPELGLKEEDCKKEYLLPELSDKIFNYSPDTSLSLHFDEFLNQCHTINDRTQYRPPVKLYFNLYPLQDTELTKRFLALLRHYLGEKIQLIPINTRPKELQSSIWIQSDYIFLDDIGDLIVDDSTFVTTLAKEEIGNYRHVIAAYHISDEQLKEWLDKGMKLFDFDSQRDFFAVAASCYSLITDFTFVNFTVPLEEGR